MKRFASTFALVVLLLVPLRAEDKPKHEDTTDGLRDAMAEIVDAQRGKDEKKVQALCKVLVLPKYEAWFKSILAPDKSGPLITEYAKIVDKVPADLAKALNDEVVKKERTEIRVFKVEKAHDVEAMASVQIVIANMKRKVPLYKVRFVVPGKETDGYTLWSFVYVDNEFRYAGKMEKIQ
jgi:hypothetical protein